MLQLRPNTVKNKNKQIFLKTSFFIKSQNKDRRDMSLNKKSNSSDTDTHQEEDHGQILNDEALRETSKALKTKI